jgi:hypothetical protein
MEEECPNPWFQSWTGPSSFENNNGYLYMVAETILSIPDFFLQRFSLHGKLCTSPIQLVDHIYKILVAVVRQTLERRIILMNPLDVFSSLHCYTLSVQSLVTAL